MVRTTAFRRVLAAAGACLLLALGDAQAQSKVTTIDERSQVCRERPTEPPGRPRIGLALGGGGARGIAHISVLRTLEAMHVPVDCVAGTSMGALVGALYASGMSPDEIEKLVLGLDWAGLFDDSLERAERSYRRKRDDELNLARPGLGFDDNLEFKVKSGVLAGQRIFLLMEKLSEPVAHIEDFDRLPIPYRAVAADINDGSTVVLRGGDLAYSMRASMSIPGAFPPVEIWDHVLVDGGVARNLPIDVVRNMGADIVIAVDVGTPLAKITTKSSVLSIADQLTGLLTVANTREQIATLGERDLLISPPLGDEVGTADFGKGREALAIGQAGVDAVRDRLAALSMAPAAYALHRAGRTGRSAEPPVVEFVRLDNHSRYRDDLIMDRVHVPIGEPLDAARLEADLARLHGLTTFRYATYEVLSEDGRTGVVLHVNEKAEGPNYFEFGLSAVNDYDGTSRYNLRLGVLRSPLKDSGSELRALVQLGSEPGILGEYYQPIGALYSRSFLATRAELNQQQLNRYNPAGDKIAQYTISQGGVGILAGREFGNYGAIALGYRRYTGSAEADIGDPATNPDIDFDVGEAGPDLTVDRIDSVYFPRDGYFANTSYIFSRESLGADTDFEQFNFDGFGARSFGPHALQFGLRYHVTTSGVAPIQSLYRLGGYGRLVGFRPNELTAQDYALVLGGYSYQLGSLLGQKALVGGTVEYGNAWQRRSDMAWDDAVLNGSVYLGLETWVGPVLFGVGAREGGERNLFLVIGQRF